MKLAKRNIRQVADEKRSKRREQLIEQFKNGWQSAGLALQELRDDEHWKDTHTSWIAFCKDNFAISKTKLYDILKYTEVVGSLSKENQQKITSIDQALALLKAPEKNRNKVVEKAESNGGLAADNLKFHVAKPVSKKNVTTTVTTVPNSGQSSSESAESETPLKPKSSPKEKEAVKLDKVGTPIPLDALPFYDKRKEVQAFLTQISKVRTRMKEFDSKENPLYFRVAKSAVDYLSRAYHVISDCKPYAICTVCQGSPTLQPQGCSFCGSTGVISELRWKNNADPRVKKLRMLSNAEYAKKHNLEEPTEQPEYEEEL